MRTIWMTRVRGWVCASMTFAMTCAMTCALTGCVVFPTSTYVADDAAGAPVYERCSLNPTVPIGVRIDRPGLHATVSLVARDDGGYAAVQYDVADGHVLVLRDDAIGIDARDGRAAMLAPIPHVNPVGPAAPKEPRAVLASVLPVHAELKGGLVIAGRVVDRHFWIAGRFDGRPGDVAWVTLPRVVLDGVPQDFAPIRFEKRFMIARGLFNC